MTYTAHRLVSLMAVGVLVLTGLFAAQSAGAITAAELEGTWFMTSETVNSPAGSIVNPATNKIVTFNSDGTVDEDFTSLEGLDATVNGLTSECTSSGFVTTSYTVTAGGFTVDANTRTGDLDTRIDCVGPSGITGLAGTNATPFEFYKTAASAAGIATWDATVSTADDLDAGIVLGNLVVTSTLGPSTLVQVYSGIGTATTGPSTNTNTNVNGNSNTNNSNGGGVTNANGNANTNASNTNVPTNDGGDPDGIAVAPTADEAELQRRLEENPNTITPPAYPAVTDPGGLELTPTEQATLGEQLTDDVQQNTSVSFADAIVDDQDPGIVDDQDLGVLPAVTLVTERGFNPRTHEPTVTLSGVLDLTHPGLPEELGDLPHRVLVTYFSDPFVKIAQADANGEWTLTVPADVFDEGEHVVYAAAEVAGTRGEQVEITRFVVQEETRLSNTTWLVIVNGVILAIILVALIVIQVRRSGNDDNGTPVGGTQQGPTAPPVQPPQQQ